MTKPIPDGFHTLTPHIIVSDAVKAIAFYKRAFGAKEVSAMRGPEGEIMHAELDLFGSRLMLANSSPQWHCFGPEHYKGSPVTLHLYVEDCDKVFAQATKAGAVVVMPVEDAFWGDRYGKLKDPFGHEWSVATHKKDLSATQIEEAGRKWMEQAKAPASA